jgi:hypothetical protein
VRRRAKLGRVPSAMNLKSMRRINRVLEALSGK